MNKVIFSMLVAAIVSVAATSANADSGISSKTLGDMGLSSLTVMSDSDALAVRGMGYRSSRHSYKNRDKDSKKSDKKPWSAVWGASFANVEAEGKDLEGEAGTENAYAAEGRYAAAGETFSEATVVKSDSEIVVIGGVVQSVTNAWSLHVEAGGFSKASSF